MSGRGEAFTIQVWTAAQLLPETAELVEWLNAADRDEAVAPIFAPAAYMRGRGRLAAMKTLVRAAVDMRSALDALRSAVAEEGGDPDADAAAALLYGRSPLGGGSAISDGGATE